MQKITIENKSNQFLEDEDVLIVLDTKAMVAERNLSATCADIVFVKEENNQTLSHYLETSCNTIDTRIYVTMNVSVETTNNTITMYHRKVSMTESISEAFDGYYYLLSNNTCGNNWEYVSEFENKLAFFTANKIEPSTGSLEHDHVIYGNLISNTNSVVENENKNGASSSYDSHSHFFIAESETVSDSESLLPPYKTVLFCRNQNLDYESKMISIFNQSLPNGIHAFNDLKEYFPLASLNFGKIGGNSSHSHKIIDTNSFVTNYQSARAKIDNDDNILVAQNDHTHLITGELNPHSNIPQYVSTLFGYIANSDEYVQDTIYNSNSNESIVFNDENYVLASAIPPKGFIINEDVNGYFLRSGNSMIFSGEAQDTKISHSHISVPKIGGPNSLCSIKLKDEKARSDDTHTHELESGFVESTFSTIDLPHFPIVLLQRKSNKNYNVMYGNIIKIGSLDENYPNDPEENDPDDEEDPETEDIGSTLPIIIILAILGGVVLLIFVIIIIIVLFIIIFSIIKKKNKKVSQKILNSIVDTAAKEMELQEEKDSLEKQKIELEEEKNKLIEQQKTEDAEKIELKKALEELKKEKLTKNNSQSLNFESITQYEDEKIKRISKLTENKALKYVTFKAQLEMNQKKKDTVLYRVFDKSLIDTEKNSIFRPLKLLEIEIGQYSQFNHPNILKYYGKSIGSSISIGVVSEFVGNGNLINFFNKKVNKSMSFLKKVRIFYEIASGIQYLHKMGIAHGDIRAINCFVDGNVRPKLDSGFNKTFNKHHIYSPYCAPELIDKNLLKDEDDDDSDDEDEDIEIEDRPELKADIYAFAVLMFEVVKIDFDLFKTKKEKVKHGEKAAKDPSYRPPLGKSSKYFPNWFINLIKMCWTHQVSRRPSISRIKAIIETIVFENNK